MRSNFLVIVITAALVFGSCNSDPVLEPVFKSYNFEDGQQGWKVDFADYPIGQEAKFALSYGIEGLPEAIPGSARGLRISGNNHSDDLFMFAYVEIEDLIPEQQYIISISLDIASDALQNAPGIGGSPGGSVFLKVGTLANEPQVIIDDDQYYRTQFDTGSQSQDGEDMKVIGTIGIPGDVSEYTLINRSTQKDLYGVPNSSGSLYILVGTDSGFEGNTTIFYDAIRVRLKPVSG
jgi:hypothetical protein